MSLAVWKYLKTIKKMKKSGQKRKSPWKCCVFVKSAENLFSGRNGTFLGPKVKKWRVIISRFFQISWKFWESVDFGFFGKKWSKKSKFLVLKMFRNLKGQSVSVTKKWELSWGKIHNFLNLLMRNGRKVPQKTWGKEASFPRKPEKVSRMLDKNCDFEYFPRKCKTLWKSTWCWGKVTFEGPL